MRYKIKWIKKKKITRKIDLLMENRKLLPLYPSWLKKIIVIFLFNDKEGDIAIIRA